MIQKLTCAIIDDEPLAVELLRSYAQKTELLAEPATYHSAVKALEHLQNEPVDLLFLDIQMPELNGLDFSRMLPPETKVVFTTAFQQYALDGFKVNALDYLLKPISYADFLTAVNKARQWFSMKQGLTNDTENGFDVMQNYMFVKADYKLLRVDFDDILYIEGLKDYVKIHFDTDERPIHSLINMKTLEERLPKSRFARIHRSYIVNLHKIKVVEKGRIVFGSTYLPISESYKQAVTDFIEGQAL